MKKRTNLKLKDLLSVLSIVLAEEKIYDAEKLDKSKAKENLKILIKCIVQSKALEALSFLIEEPNSRAAKILLKRDLKELLDNDVRLKSLSLSILSNSDLLKDVKSITFVNLNFSDNGSVIQIGNNNIVIGNARSLDIQIGDDNVYFEF